MKWYMKNVLNKCVFRQIKLEACGWEISYSSFGLYYITISNIESQAIEKQNFSYPKIFLL